MDVDANRGKREHGDDVAEVLVWDDDKQDYVEDYRDDEVGERNPEERAESRWV